MSVRLGVEAKAYRVHTKTGAHASVDCLGAAIGEGGIHSERDKRVRP